MNVIDIQRQMRSFSQGGGINVSDMDYTSRPTPMRVRAGYVDAGLLATLGIPPMLGRTISPEVQKCPQSIVVSPNNIPIRSAIVTKHFCPCVSWWQAIFVLHYSFFSAP